MNKAKILEYAAKFEAMDPDNFGISDEAWKDGIVGKCGCVAAWICYWEGSDTSRGYFSTAAESLGVDRQKARSLCEDVRWSLFCEVGIIEISGKFVSVIDYFPDYKLTPQDVAQCMRNLAETGKVSWDFLEEKING